MKKKSFIFEKGGIKYKKCPCCEKTLELNTENYYIGKNGNIHYYCKKCNDSLSLEKKRQKKLKAIEYKGGKCIVCGYKKYFGSLDFHHVDPSKKEFTISSFRTYSWEKMKVEIDKCVLVCKNCHGEIEAGITQIP